VWLWNLASPSPSVVGEGENDRDLLKDKLFYLTFPRRHFFLLPIRKIDDQMVGLLRRMLQINRAGSLLEDDDQGGHRRGWL
jgi:hypothetical protein